MLVVLGVATSSACTHLNPYYRADQPTSVEPARLVDIDHRLLLIGDAGDANLNGDALLSLLAYQARQMPDRTTVTFLGDNVYERGMPPPVTKPGEQAADTAKQIADAVFLDLFASRQAAEQSLNAQLDVVRGTKARAIFVPGNHDYDQFEPGGWSRILEEEKFIQAADVYTDVNAELLPAGGCAGPTAIPLGAMGELITLNTQWWLDPRLKHDLAWETATSNCTERTEPQVRSALVTELKAAAAQRRWVIVAAHHPLESEGPHGGFSDPLAHFFPLRILQHYVPFYLQWIPLPGLGSLVVGLRQCCSPSPQDASNGTYKHMRQSFTLSLAEAAKEGAAPLVWAAGHDHSLQLFESTRGARYSLVSGMGSRASDVGTNRHTLFAQSNSLHPGFMQIDFLRDGSVRLAVLEVDSDQPEGLEVYSALLIGAHSFETPR